MAEEIQGETENETNDSPIEQVRLTVPITDDPTLPVITFRTWVLGPISCMIEAFTQQYFSYRQNSLYIPPQCFRMLYLPIGRFMAATLPTKAVRIPWTKQTFSMNPGPFNIKEHVLISIFATAGIDNPFGLDLVMMSKIFYKKNISIVLALLLTFTTQLSGYGLAGMFMKFLVDSPLMWWPLCLVDVSLFRALHEKESRPKGQLTRLQFLLLTAISSFAYAIIPNYFFPSIGALSVLCWFWKDSVLAQQIGSGRFGLGIGSFAFDWSAINGTIGNPLATPMFAVVNLLIGFILFLYILTPIAYWSNSYNAKRFPFSAYDLLDFNGQVYNTSRVVNETDVTFNQKEYTEYSKIYMSTLQTYAYGFNFAMTTSVLTEFLLSHGRDLWHQLKKAYKGSKDQSGDVHNRLMNKYSSIPQWWFYVILVSTISLSIYTSEGFGKQAQLPYWGVLLAYLIVFVLTLPFGVVQATTGQTMNIYHLSQMVMGYVYPGKPLANLVFRAYGVSTMEHAHSFLADFKLAHYMKIPPKSMFFVQVIGTMLSTCTSFITALWLLSTVDNICDVTKLPMGSPWTCPSSRSAFSSNIIWGLVGPSRVFAPNGLYSGMYYFFVIGIVATLVTWMLSRLFPKTKWIGLVNVPMILRAPISFPSSGAVNYWSAFTVAILFNYIIYRKYKGWWAKYNYILASALDMGGSFMLLLTSFSLQPNGIYGVQWWGLDVNDHCPLAQCPTAPGVQVKGCPQVHQ